MILILLASVVVQAQTIADVARRERARQAQVTATKVFTTADLKSNDSKETVEAKPEENPAAVATPPEKAAQPVVDPVQQWTEETGKLRTQIRDLMDQETKVQLDINAASAQINAPITSQSAKNQAQQTLEASQQKLTQIQAELAKARSELQEKDLAGPPLKK